MSKLRDILNYEITPKRRKKDKKRSRSFASLDFEFIKVLMLLSGPIGLIYYWTAYQKIRLNRMHVLFRTIRMIVDNNAPLTEGLRMMALDAPDSRVGFVLNGLSDQVEQGASLAEALESYPNIFHRRYVDLVGIGERTGRLKTCLEQVETSIRDRLNTARSVTANMSYIFIVLFFQIFIISFLVVKVLPVFVEIYSEFSQAPPLYAKALLDIASFVSEDDTTIAMGLIFSALAAGVYFLLYRNFQVIRSLTLRMLFLVPIIGRILRLRQLHRISEALEECVGAQLPVHDVFRHISELNLATPYKRRMAVIAERLHEGQSLKEALGTRTWLLGRTFGAVLGFGDYAGNLDEASARLKSLYGRELSWRVALASDSMIPVYVIIGGALNFWILLTTYGMIFGLNDAISINL